MSTVDFQPTLLRLMGLEPCGREQGHDASALLRGESCDWTDEAHQHHNTHRLAGVFTREWHLAYVQGGQPVPSTGRRSRSGDQPLPRPGVRRCGARADGPHRAPPPRGGLARLRVAGRAGVSVSDVSFRSEPRHHGASAATPLSNPKTPNDEPIELFVGLPARAPLEEALDVCSRTGYRRVEVIALGSATGVDLADWRAERPGETLSSTGRKWSRSTCGPSTCAGTPRSRNRSITFGSASTPPTPSAARALSFRRSSRARATTTPDWPRDAGRPWPTTSASADVALAVRPTTSGRSPTRRTTRACSIWIDDPRVGVTMDTGHFTSSGVNMLAFVERLAERGGTAT